MTPRGRPCTHVMMVNTSISDPLVNFIESCTEYTIRLAQPYSQIIGGIEGRHIEKEHPSAANDKVLQNPKGSALTHVPLSCIVRSKDPLQGKSRTANKPLFCGAYPADPTETRTRTRSKTPTPTHHPVQILVRPAVSWPCYCAKPEPCHPNEPNQCDNQASSPLLNAPTPL